MELGKPSTRRDPLTLRCQNWGSNRPGPASRTSETCESAVQINMFLNELAIQIEWPTICTDPSQQQVKIRLGKRTSSLFSQCFCFSDSFSEYIGILYCRVLPSCSEESEESTGMTLGRQSLCPGEVARKAPGSPTGGVPT